MLQSKVYKILEFVLIFLVIPCSFLWNYPVGIKIAIALLGFAYIVWVLIRAEHTKVTIRRDIAWKPFWRQIAVTMGIIAVFTLIYMFLVDRENIFRVVWEKPLMWGLIVIIYSVTSVYPQELIYRTFFAKRYEGFFQNRWVYIFSNAFIFSWAHIIFWNPLVLALTFIGGLFFARTYDRTRSTFLVSIEHAIYGSWLFTVGMGPMLGFPS